MTKAVTPAAPAAPAAEAPAPAAPAPDTLLGTPAPAAPAPVAPAEYKLTAPEGIDDKHVEATVEWARTNKVSPEAAQAVLARDAQRAAAEKAEFASWRETALSNLRAAYTPDTLHDLDVSVTSFVRQTFGDKVAEWMKSTGVIFDRNVFDGFAKLAKAGREAPMARTGPATPVTPSLAKREFPNSPALWPAHERTPGI